MFTDLPDEMIEKICEQMSTKDLLNTARASNRIRNVCSKFVISSLLNQIGDNLESYINVNGHYIEIKMWDDGTVYQIAEVISPIGKHNSILRQLFPDRVSDIPMDPANYDEDPEGVDDVYLHGYSNGRPIFSVTLEDVRQVLMELDNRGINITKFKSFS